MEIAPLGDSALIVRVRNAFEDAPEQTSYEVLRALRRIEDARISGVIELATASTTVAVIFDPRRVIDDSASVYDVIETRRLISHAARSRGRWLKSIVNTT